LSDELVNFNVLSGIRIMHIHHFELVEGARHATGLTVVIDVFRAFSTVCYLYGQGAEKVLAAATPEDAFAFRKQDPRVILAGERQEKKITGFDFGNSPSEVLKHDLTGRTVVLTTSAGTLGLVSAGNASGLLTGSLVNAGAIVQYIRQKNPETVSLVAMGYNAVIPADEDRMCARYIEAKLMKSQVRPDLMEQSIRNGTGSRFFDPENLNSPEEDYHLCLDIDRFPFVLVCEKSNKYLFLKKIDMP